MGGCDVVLVREAQQLPKTADSKPNQHPLKQNLVDEMALVSIRAPHAPQGTPKAQLRIVSGGAIHITHAVSSLSADRRRRALVFFSVRTHAHSDRDCDDDSSTQTPRAPRFDTYTNTQPKA